MSYKVKDGKTAKNPKTVKQYPHNSARRSLFTTGPTETITGHWWWLDERYPDDMHPGHCKQS